MSIAVSLIEQLVVSRTMVNGSHAGDSFKTRFSLCALAFFFAIIGVLFSVYAGYLWVSSLFPTEIAALYISGACLGIALIAALATHCLKRHRKRRMEQARQDFVNTIMQIIGNIDKEMTQPIEENPKTAMALAVLAGYIAGNKFL